MIIGLIIVLSILSFVFLIIAGVSYENEKMWLILFMVSGILALSIIIFGGFHGFINYSKTEGTHVGIITAVDLEGKYFRRYEVYLKSSGYTEQSDETVYKIYDYENELAQQLQQYLGKKVKLTYGHDGGYVNWKSCGTYHIKSVELIEE